MKILLLDDEPNLIKGYAVALERDGYSVDIVSTAEDAKAYILRHPTTVAVLDVNLLPSAIVTQRKLEQEQNGLSVYVEEEGEGFRVAAWIKAHSPTTGVVMLTSERTDIADRIQGLDIGADDYIQKGMEYAEFCARMRALVRRLTPKEPDIFKLGHLEFDFKARTLFSKDGRSVELTATEAKLVETFCLQRGNTLNRSDLYRWAFGTALPDKSGRAIDNLISKIRGKVEDGLNAELPISAVYGVGYKLTA